MITATDIVMIGLAITIGYIDDMLGPQPYIIKGQLVYVYSKYQCPSYCGIKHMHYVDHENPDSVGERISKKKLEKIKPLYNYR